MPEIFATERLGIVGCGVMAESIMAGILQGGILPKDRIRVSHPRAERRAMLSERYGVTAVPENAVAADADVVLLGIKPQMLTLVMKELAGNLREDQLVVSIVAGATLEALRTGLHHDLLVRTMPNTPAQIGKGVLVWCATREVTDRSKEHVRMLLGALGYELEVTDERQVAMATAISGTGPTYIFFVIEALTDAGVHMGFPRHIAKELVLRTLEGTCAFALQSGKHVAELRDMVTSPGGTSAEALYHMEAGRLKTVLSDAVWAAFGRTLEIEAKLENRPPELHPKGTPGRP